MCTEVNTSIAKKSLNDIALGNFDYCTTILGLILQINTSYKL
jgi:hypothetical protein